MSHEKTSSPVRLERPYFYKTPVGVFSNTISPVVGVFNFILLAFPILIINCLQLMTLLVLPVSTRIFRGLNRGFANYWWGSIVFMMEKFYGMKFIYTGDQIPSKEHVISFSNHQGMVDIPVLMPLAWRMGRLGDLKFFVKDIIKYTPGPGWGMLFIGCIFVRRDWHADEANINRIFARFKKNSVPIWLISFLEGTRISPKKLRESRDFAHSRGQKALDHLMIPRTKGFVGSVIGLRDHVTAVYDFTIGYPEGIPSIWTMLRVFPREFHIHVRRFSIESLPESRGGLARWLFDRYEEKDALLDVFYKTGRFPESDLVAPFSSPDK